MSAAKPTPGTELVEPLRQFLESFTQELTEQQFIPAFRGELGKLAEGLDNIQQSGETLQQIARGVDRLRDVFAPAGTRMLEGVKDLESQLKNGGDQLRSRAEEVLTQLLATQRDLEQALRTESGLLIDQNSASRDALGRLASDVEGQLNSFAGKLDALCRKAEQEIEQISQISSRAVEQVSVGIPRAAEATVAMPVQVVASANTEEVAQLLSRTENTVSEELARYSSELRDLLSSNTKDHDERLVKIDKTIDDALRAVAPRVQSELDSALTRLRDQMDALVRAEREAPVTPSTESQAPAVVDTSSFVTALSSAENRLLREFDEQRKSGAHDLSEIQKGLADFALDLAEVTEKQTERIEREQQTVKELLLKLDRMAKERAASLAKVGKQVEDQLQTSEGLRNAVTQSGAQTQQQLSQVSDQLSSQQNGLKSHGELLSTLQQSGDERFSQLRGFLTRLDEQSNKLIELQAQEARTTRERVDAGVADLRSRWDSRVEIIVQKSEEVALKLTQELGGQLELLKQDVDHRLHDLGEALRADFTRFDAIVREQTREHEAHIRDLSTEVSRVTGQIDEKLSNFESRREENERFTRAIESHVKVVATEVSALRSKQQEQIEVFKEAIRANYDDNAARLREVIDGAYDKFLEQIRTIPQALERYSKFIETMNQSNQLALQGISGNTENLLTVAHELKADNEAQKKFFPLLNKSLEKQGQVLDAVRRSQADHDKAFAQTGKSLHESREEATKFLIDLKAELRRVEGAEQTKLAELNQMLGTTFAELEKLQRTDLPAFRREVIQLLQSKFEFIETTQAERIAALKTELFSRLDEQQKVAHKNVRMLAVLIALGIAAQFALHYRVFSFFMP
ncbi:MAG: hypothetical protein H6508_08815 [Calditrichaeota bacterium]|nr:hypothetical protein [Calditrichota bacterium]